MNDTTPDSATTSSPAATDKPAAPWGIAALVGFVTLAVLLITLAITESNGVGSAAGIVGILSGICLGMWLVRTEPPPPESVRGGVAGEEVGDVDAHDASGPAPDTGVSD